MEQVFKNVLAGKKCTALANNRLSVDTRQAGKQLYARIHD